ncbi:MAG: sigma 54-interacting transcriptional regulator [Anaerovorax sp.]|nr:sigma 54-interacting transcriptional regulator [Anaerovorax sp.]
MIDIASLKLNHLDYLLVVNRNYSIVYGSRYDMRVHDSLTLDNRNYMNRNLFEVYPSIHRETSSFVKCMTTGEIVVKKNQQFYNDKGHLFCTNNITFPLILKGQIIGAVELSQDVTTIDNLSHKMKLNQNKKFDELANSIKRDANGFSFKGILTRNETMRKNIERAKVLAQLPRPTLIYGETGTGKELFAQAMISSSGISKKKVVIQNCASVPENLIESILFGTAKGAYTGAENHKGLFEEADGGIFFLDELNSLPYHVQGKLLRVLEEGTFRPVGANTEKKVSVKIIATINVDPLDAIERHELRRDLFYRLSSGMIYLPPLRERKDDILFYAKHYIQECNEIYDKNITGITDDLKNIFLNYRWDGNVRELKHIVESMISISEHTILDVKDLPAYMHDRIIQKDEPELSRNQALQKKGIPNLSKIDKEYFDLKKNLERTEKQLVIKALQISEGNKTKAAELLGIPRQTLKYKIDKLNIL